MAAVKTTSKCPPRLLAKIVGRTASATDGQKLALGLSIRKTPAPRPAPAAAPIVELISVNGLLLKMRLHGDGPGKRGRPLDAAGASIFSFVGEYPSEDRSAWKFEGSTSRM